MGLVQRLIGLGVDLSTKKALKKTLGVLGLKPENIDHLYIELKNEIYKDRFRKLKPKQKIVFIPQCLRKVKKCKAKIGDNGYECVNCSKDCKASMIKKLVEESGYRAFIVPGGSMIVKLMKKHKPKGILGIACLNEISIAAEHINMPAQSVELLRDGCIDTDVDIEKIKQKLEIK